MAVGGSRLTGSPIHSFSTGGLRVGTPDIGLCGIARRRLSVSPRARATAENRDAAVAAALVVLQDNFSVGFPGSSYLFPIRVIVGFTNCCSFDFVDFVPCLGFSSGFSSLQFVLFFVSYVSSPYPYVLVV